SIRSAVLQTRLVRDRSDRSDRSDQSENRQSQRVWSPAPLERVRGTAARSAFYLKRRIQLPHTPTPREAVHGSTRA
ncbi:MAG TPA: hypothetical protein VNL71_20345, partial [Chloroflexota bacterium]|nr:hypothetical protein [Chloroflexota bacterium]